MSIIQWIKDFIYPIGPLERSYKSLFKQCDVIENKIEQLPIEKRVEHYRKLRNALAK